MAYIRRLAQISTRQCHVRTRIAAVVFGAMCAVSLVAVPTTVAQQRGGGGFDGGGFGGGGFGGFGGQDTAISTRHVEQIAQKLSLDAGQAEAVKTLHQGYDAHIREVRDAMQAMMRDARDAMRDGDRSAMEGMQGQMQEFRRAQEVAEQEFVDNVQLMLTDVQIEQWGGVDRMLRRERTLRRGLMSGERVDIINLTSELELSDEVRQEMHSILDEYEVSLDRELVRRNEFQAKMQDKIREMFQSRDMEAADSMIQEGRKYSIGVRDVNTKYARMVAEVLPEDVRADFDRRVQRASFPDVYRPTRSERSFDAALGFSDIDASQSESISLLRDSYSRKASEINSKLVKLTEEREMNFSIADMAQRMGNRNGGDDNDPMGELRREKRQLDASTLEEMQKLLTPDQVSRLPKDDNNQPGNFGSRQQGNGRQQQDRGNNRGGQRTSPRERF